MRYVHYIELLPGDMFLDSNEFILYMTVSTPRIIDDDTDINLNFVSLSVTRLGHLDIGDDDVGTDDTNYRRILRIS